MAEHELAAVPEPPKRLRAADVIAQLERVIEALTTRSSEPSASVEFTLNAKGETQHTVKIAAPGGTHYGAIQAVADDCYRAALDLHERAIADFPRETPAPAK